MKNCECSIVRDILPLYVEDIISEDTKQFVEEHICKCSECKKELERLESDIPMIKNHQETDDSTQAIKKIRLNIKKKRVFTSVLSSVISVVVVVLLFAYLTAPEYLPYTESENFIIADENNGIVTLSFTGEYELSQSEKGVYSVSLYDTVWSKFFDSDKEKTVTVNPDGKEVKTIYYVSNGEQEDKVIYGTDPVTNGGVLTLPRLFLNYYLLLAVFATLILLMFYLILRKKEKVKAIITKTLFAPVSYILSHIMITGWDATSYSASRDFYLILLLTIPVYFVFYIIYKKKNTLEKRAI